MVAAASGLPNARANPPLGLLDGGTAGGRLAMAHEGGGTTVTHFAAIVTILALSDTSLAHCPKCTSPICY